MLDHKRSNAINIGMTKLPPPRSIKTAILKMDATVMNREGIEVIILYAHGSDKSTIRCKVLCMCCKAQIHQGIPKTSSYPEVAIYTKF